MLYIVIIIIIIANANAYSDDLTQSFYFSAICNFGRECCVIKRKYTYTAFVLFTFYRWPTANFVCNRIQLPFVRNHPRDFLLRCFFFFLSVETTLLTYMINNFKTPLATIKLCWPIRSLPRYIYTIVYSNV